MIVLKKGRAELGLLYHSYRGGTLFSINFPYLCRLVYKNQQANTVDRFEESVLFSRECVFLIFELKLFRVHWMVKYKRWSHNKTLDLPDTLFGKRTPYTVPDTDPPTSFEWTSSQGYRFTLTTGALYSHRPRLPGSSKKHHEGWIVHEQANDRPRLLPDQPMVISTPNDLEQLIRGLQTLGDSLKDNNKHFVAREGKPM